MRDATACGADDPGVEVGVEIVDPGLVLNSMICANFMATGSHAFASSTMLNGVSATRRKV